LDGSIEHAGETRRRRSRNCALVPLLLLCWGCTPIGLWISELRPPPVAGPQVETLPAFYDPAQPMPAYSGPHPTHSAWRPRPADYPILPGQVGPIDHSLGPLQYPFACQTEESGLGAPLVDNQHGWGTPVTRDGIVVGYSVDCLAPTQIGYYYLPVNGRELRPYDPAAPPDDADIAVAHNGGRNTPFVVRLERGTINRFIYAIAMLTRPGDDEAHLALWNRRLLYQFRGGVGIGKQQGRATASTVTRDVMSALGEGYAAVLSTGTFTRHHYDMLRAGHTAAMVKAQFEAAYGKPEHTIGIGGSGGGALQYVIAQNHPGLLDGLIPIYSYPDMITQTNWALDCELLEHYFDRISRSSRWRRPKARTAVLGLAASNSAANPFNAVYRWSRLARLEWEPARRGGTACALAWRGLTPVASNPRFLNGHQRYAPAVKSQERWSHWHDLRTVYGVDTNGYANRTWSNEGVQYGLEALRGGELSPEEFLHLNAGIGTWKTPKEMEGERYWLLSGPLARRNGFADVSIWSAHNMHTGKRGHAKPKDFAPDSTRFPPVAPRTRGAPEPVRAAFRSGQVFLGRLDLPILDVRHYLDPKLDMHHSFASLATRSRMHANGGNTDDHVIWMAAWGYDFVNDALAVMDAWLSGERPEQAVDSCYDKRGNVIARGAGVWDGTWNGRDDGACTTRFPPFRSPRNAAGEPAAGDVFRCALRDVQEYASSGGYAPIDMKPYLSHLRRVFPRGVCDYRLMEPGRPSIEELLATE
jgi:hypothetical protein